MTEIMQELLSNKNAKFVLSNWFNQDTVETFLDSKGQGDIIITIHLS